MSATRIAGGRNQEKRRDKVAPFNVQILSQLGQPGVSSEPPVDGAQGRYPG